MTEQKKNNLLPVDEAVGMVLSHDITEIIPGVFKGRAFKKGHIVRPEDIARLKRLGKEHIQALSLGADEIHEDEAALCFAKALAGPGIDYGQEPVEGKIAFTAGKDGLLKINRQGLLRFNLLGELMCATLQTNTPVRRGDQVAATRLIPLVAKRSLVEQAAAIAQEEAPILQVAPLRQAAFGLVITGNEVYEGRIEDKFEPVLRRKVGELGGSVALVRFAPDQVERIAVEIRACLAAGADCIITSGGMSVDPDDVTRLGVAAAGAEDIVYGTPVLPGAMLLVARIGAVPVVGVPACGMFHRITVLDLILPRLLSGETIGRAELAELGHGGLCRNCSQCQYPICSFGKS